MWADMSAFNNIISLIAGLWVILLWSIQQKLELRILNMKNQQINVPVTLLQILRMGKRQLSFSTNKEKKRKDSNTYQWAEEESN